ncbi:MAG TPA: DUF885 domain-containing protein, partial [Acidimicrobiales bacterium]|nr:DUF885 domain-containing protein [Acidimicrobiales bacterium]
SWPRHQAEPVSEDAASEVDAVAADHVAAWVELNPSAAVVQGLPSPPGALTDFSPAGAEARADLARSTLARLRKVEPASRREVVARDFMAERLAVELDMYDAGERLRDVRPIGSPLQATRQVFDMLGRSTDDEWADIAARMSAVPASLAGYRRSLEEGVSRGVMAARRQARVSAAQAAVTAGMADRPGYFRRLAAQYAGGAGALASSLADAAAGADRATAELGEFLAGDYAAAAPGTDAVGPERYAMWSRQSNGGNLDIEATYTWGWEELRRIRAAMAETAGRIVPGGGTDEAVALLESDPARSIEGVDAFIGWLQELMDRTMGELADRHFDIPGPIRRVEAMVAPEGSAAAMYYTRPSEDFSRPGRTWYPTLGRTRFPLWIEVTTAHHEGVPGHHLQLGMVRWMGERLNPFQRLLGGVSAYIEGWALYAEVLMAELGYLGNPDHLMGLLASECFRAARVVVDIGLHLGLRLPDDEPVGGGQVWTPELAEAFMLAAGRRSQAFTRSEVERYLGMPGQAISYKVGERAWMETRRECRRSQGERFDLRRFHACAFELGPVGIDQLRADLPRVAADPAP